MREALLTAIYSHILANPDDPFVKAIGENYAAWELPQGGPYPSAVSYIVSDMDSGAIGMEIPDFEWQMSIYSDDLTELNQLAAACKKLFADQSLPLTAGPACSFTCGYEATFGPMRKDDTSPYQITVTFTNNL